MTGTVFHKPEGVHKYISRSSGESMVTFSSLMKNGCMSMLKEYFEAWEAQGYPWVKTPSGWSPVNYVENKEAETTLFNQRLV